MEGGRWELRSYGSVGLLTIVRWFVTHLDLNRGGGMVGGREVAYWADAMWGPWGVCGHCVMVSLWNEFFSFLNMDCRVEGTV